MVVTRRAAQLDSQTTQAPHKEDLFADLDKFRRRWNCFSCQTFGFLVLLLFVGLVFGAVWLVAATGLVHVPFVSAYAYPRDPQPVRVVVPVQTGAGGEFLAKKLETLGFETATALVSVELTENELTGLLREPDQDGSVPLKQGQLAIEPGVAELYGQLPIRQGERTVTVRLALQTNGPRLDVTGVKVGYVTIPLDLGKNILRFVGGNPQGLSLEQLGITSVVFQKQAVRATIDPKKLPHEER